MVTLFKDALNILFRDGKNININPYSSETLQICYEHYVNWLQNNTELQIGANYMTNEQLFWVASAIADFRKFHKSIPKSIDQYGRLKNEYLNSFSINQNGFLDAFKCNLTENDKKKLLKDAAILEMLRRKLI